MRLCGLHASCTIGTFFKKQPPSNSQVIYWRCDAHHTKPPLHVLMSVELISVVELSGGGSHCVSLHMICCDRGVEEAWKYSDEEDDRGEVEWKRTTVEDQDDERARMRT